MTYHVGSCLGKKNSGFLVTLQSYDQKTMNNQDLLCEHTPDILGGSFLERLIVSQELAAPLVLVLNFR